TPPREIIREEGKRERAKTDADAISTEITTEDSTTAETTAETVTTATDDNVSSESTTTTAFQIIDVSQAERGNIYDINGKLLVKSDKDGNRKYTEEYKYSLGNIVSEVSGGVETAFDDILRAENPSSPYTSENMGKSIQLTINADIQKQIYDYMDSVNLVGSVVVMRTDGSLLADVSYPSFDPELYHTDKEYAENVGHATENKSIAKQPPGSCFKIMTEIIADKHEIYSLWDEGEWYSDEGLIVDWDHDKNSYYPMERSLYSAFVNSSNIYFAKVFDELGEETSLKELEEMFHFGNGCDIVCDFGTIESSLEITCKDDLRRSAFGQSYVRTSPLFLASLCREALFGDMVRPFMLKNIVNSGSSQPVLAKGTKAYESIATYPKECQQNIHDGMLGVASGLGVWAGENYEFFAKTGTAETGGADILYITGCLKNVNDKTNRKPEYTDYSDYHENGSYILVMQMQNPDAYGFDFSSESAFLYQGLVNIVVNQ
ncbi:MAG: hypothetical protein K2J08_12675, partial [Ruminococcus sp.]|nr:hypothetical protein [Ruminococcus sp.]